MMDLMIDCLPLYEMLEDDMRTIANLNCSSFSCLSDEEQLALTSCTSMLDDFLLFNNNNNTTTSSCNNNSNSSSEPHQSMSSSSLNLPNYNNQNNYNCLNNSLNSSVSSYSPSSGYSTPGSTSGTSSPLSSHAADSPLSLSLSSSSSLCNALANTSFNSSLNITNNNSPCPSTSTSSLSSPVNYNQSYDEFNNSSNSNSNQQYQPVQQQEQFNSSTTTTNQKYMQDAYLNNNFNLYQVINPMDINRNYQQQQSQQMYNNNNSSGNTILRLPTSLSTLLSTSTTVTTPNKLDSNNYSHQVKRGKFGHMRNDIDPSELSDNSTKTTSNINNTINSILSEKLQIKIEFNSDGESSMISSENDSNSNCSSLNNDDLNQSNSSLQQQQQQHHQQLTKLSHINISSINSKKVIIATKLEPFSNTFQLQSNCNSNGQHQLSFEQQQINLIKITNDENTKNKASDSSSVNNKKIVHYKQLVNNNGKLIKTTQLKQKHMTTTSVITTNGITGENINTNHNGVPLALRPDGKVYPKPPYSYSCLIAMTLRNSDSGNLPVSDIYDFIIENFPYYKTARDGWKNSIRHNLSLNKCFEKIENPTNGSKKGCLWALNPDKCKKLEEECKRCRQRDPVNIRLSMSRPDDLNKIERGEQRLKKYPSPNQRKLIESHACNNINLNVLVKDTLSVQCSNNQSIDIVNMNNFLPEWTSKSSPIEVKVEETDYFDDLENSDIKFDPILLTSSIRVNI